MCLFLEMVWVKKCCNLRGAKYFPVIVNIFFVLRFLKVRLCGKELTVAQMMVAVYGSGGNHCVGKGKKMLDTVYQHFHLFLPPPPPPPPPHTHTHIVFKSICLQAFAFGLCAKDINL